ncbi:hypothetical protein QY97_00357 [Bacillus thermotolerans]|uniref:Uncharacterized protein n=1 Tax=Bacillus thermotolerans TaxID=1221996 RepID=A0A0F5HQF9_BACTR|nr:hypothetical protein QY97_00357 [Bacillus thermotolerans]KKB33647.1 hypothetical protein QY96_00416 [Bacillus thermotolerans]KKB35589.1 hypothetical protein QY95_03442 [Bacillus thermotolerans]
MKVFQTLVISAVKLVGDSLFIELTKQVSFKIKNVILSGN